MVSSFPCMHACKKFATFLFHFLASRRGRNNPHKSSHQSILQVAIKMKHGVYNIQVKKITYITCHSFICNCNFYISFKWRNDRSTINGVIWILFIEVVQNSNTCFLLKKTTYELFESFFFRIDTKSMSSLYKKNLIQESEDFSQFKIQLRCMMLQISSSHARICFWQIEV